MMAAATEVHLPTDGTGLYQIPDGPPLVFDRDLFLCELPDRRVTGTAKNPAPLVNWANLDAAMRRGYSEPSPGGRCRRLYVGEWMVEVGPPELMPSS